MGVNRSTLYFDSPSHVPALPRCNRSADWNERGSDSAAGSLRRMPQMGRAEVAAGDADLVVELPGPGLAIDVRRVERGAGDHAGDPTQEGSGEHPGQACPGPDDGSGDRPEKPALRLVLDPVERSRRWRAPELHVPALKPETKARVDASLALGKSVDVTGTPTLFINGRKIGSFDARLSDVYKSLVEFAAKQGK